MKKKTVITTEKREVWVIRQAGSETETETTNNESARLDSLITLPEQCTENEFSPAETDESETLQKTRTANV